MVSRHCFEQYREDHSGCLERPFRLSFLRAWHRPTAWPTQRPSGCRSIEAINQSGCLHLFPTTPIDCKPGGSSGRLCSLHLMEATPQHSHDPEYQCASFDRWCGDHCLCCHWRVLSNYLRRTQYIPGAMFPCLRILCTTISAQRTLHLRNCASIHKQIHIRFPWFLKKSCCSRKSLHPWLAWQYRPFFRTCSKARYRMLWVLEWPQNIGRQPQAVIPRFACIACWVATGPNRGRLSAPWNRILCLQEAHQKW
jgi:hypothetical protein